MARKKKAKKSGLPLDVEQSILGMKPSDLAIEVTFERNAIEAVKAEKGRNEDLKDLKKTLKTFEDELKGIKEVAAAIEKLEELKAENMSDDHIKAKADVAALGGGYNDELKERKKKLNYMEKTLSRHIESGALKRTKG